MRVVRRRKPWWIVIVAIPIFCIWWPIGAGIEKSRDIKRGITERTKQKAAGPKPLPRNRPRALSIAKEEEGWSTLIGRAGMFGRLPYEIRQMIYTYVLGHYVIALNQSPGQRKIGHWLYRYDQEDDPSPLFLEFLYQNPLSFNKLSLLKTCRIIYIESVRALYATNTFGFFNTQSFTYSCFSRTVLPQRLACITSIHLSLSSCSFRLDKWSQSWNDAAMQLTGLRDVKVWLLEQDLMPHMEISLDAEWVKPMLVMKGLRGFYLSVRAAACNDPYSGLTFYQSNAPISSEQDLEYFNKLEKLRVDLRERMCA